jgi:hypothetical protein
MAGASSDRLACCRAGLIIRVCFTPTVAHCSMATLIGLCIRVKLQRVLPQRFKVDIQVCGDVRGPGPPSSRQLQVGGPCQSITERCCLRRCASVCRCVGWPIVYARMTSCDAHSIDAVVESAFTPDRSRQAPIAARKQ